MNTTPKRPVVFRFVFGKGLVKRRQESINTTRAIVEQAAISWIEGSWEDTKKQLAAKITDDIRAELTHLAGLFRRNVIGAPSKQRGLVGRLDTLVSGGPTETLGSLPRWAPRGAKYLKRKQDGAGHTNWFDNTGWTGGMAPVGAGTLRKFFQSRVGTTSGGASIHLGSGGIFETMFGPVSVEITRNNTATSGAPLAMDGRGTHIHQQLGTIRVRALGRLSDNMLKISDTPNAGLLSLVAAEDRAVAVALRGGKGRYRPALEPYLRFFLRRSIGAAVDARMKKATTRGYAR